jgi:hypothetical protein
MRSPSLPGRGWAVGVHNGRAVGGADCRVPGNLAWAAVTDGSDDHFVALKAPGLENTSGALHGDIDYPTSLLWSRGLLWLAVAAVSLVAEGEDRRLDAVLQMELGEDIADVGLDGLLADRQFAADLPVAATARDEVQDLAFAR